MAKLGNIPDFAFAFALSREHIARVMFGGTWTTTVVMLVLALLIISLPARSPLSALDYAYNLTVTGGGVVSICAVISIISAYPNGGVQSAMRAMLRMVSSALIINGIILGALYLIGMPLGASSILWAAWATLMSTYYIIVLIAIAAPVASGAEGKRKYIVEFSALAMWYLFTFHLITLTV